MRFRDYYRTKLPRWIQWSAPALLVLGIVGVAVGSWAIGSTDWWDPNSFRINVASALATACIGVPFAIVGLAYITESREIRSSLTEIASLTEQAWDRFKRTALSVTTPAVTSYLITDAQAVDKSVANIRIRLTHYQTLAGVPKGASPYDDVIKHPEQIDETKIRDEIAEMIRELQIPVDKIRGAIDDSTTIGRDWTELRMRWSYLLDEIRRRRFAMNLGWIPGELELDIESQLNGVAPLFDVLSALQHIETFVADLERYLSQPSVNHLLNPAYLYTTYTRIDARKLTDASVLAVASLNELRKSVLAADTDSWRS